MSFSIELPTHGDHRRLSVPPAQPPPYWHFLDVANQIFSLLFSTKYAINSAAVRLPLEHLKCDLRHWIKNTCAVVMALNGRESCAGQEQRVEVLEIATFLQNLNNCLRKKYIESALSSRRNDYRPSSEDLIATGTFGFQSPLRQAIKHARKFLHSYPAGKDQSSSWLPLKINRSLFVPLLAAVSITPEISTRKMLH